MRTAVDDIHHRNRQRLGVRSTGYSGTAAYRANCRGMSASQRHAENRIGAEVALGSGSVERDHRFVDADLIGHLHAENLLGDDFIHILNGLQHAFSAITPLCRRRAVRALVFAGRGSGRNGCTADSPACGSYPTSIVGFPLESRISCMNTDNLSHDNFP